LFTANVRDHGLGHVVGTQTYGKGTMQTTYLLSNYGLSGALKLTTRYYDPPSGENYDGVGITPDLVVDLSEEAMSYHINLLPDDKDDQLQAAISNYLVKSSGNK
jgi:carboxyl-terminal processing protease